MDRNLVEFDGSRHRLLFHGDCTEMRDICEAMCCRMEWHILLSSEEYASGQYQSDITCTLTNKDCRDISSDCINRRYQLARQEDGSCVHLKENRCSIYTERPKTCRDFQCRGGWRIHGSVFPPGQDSQVEDPNPPSREAFVGGLKDTFTFVPHPLIKVHAVFYRKARKDIVFLKEMVGRCGKFNTNEDFNYPQLDDVKVMRLIELINHKETLGSIYEKFCRDYPDVLMKNGFYEIIWLLNKHNIVLDSRNFKGMLGGVGALE